MKKKIILVVGMFSALIVIGVVTIWWLKQPVIYKCTDLRTRLPAFFKIITSSTNPFDSEPFIRLDVHDPDGSIYVIGGTAKNYSRFSRGSISYSVISQPDRFVLLDRQTGSYSVGTLGETPDYSGICEM